MVPDFKFLERSNGDIDILFHKDGRECKIIFSKDSEAYIALVQLYVSNNTSIKEIRRRMKKKYFFKANADNKSIFRPYCKI